MTYSLKIVTSILITGPPTGDDCSHLQKTHYIITGAFVMQLMIHPESSWYHHMPADNVPQPFWLAVWRTVLLAVSVRLRMELEVVWKQKSLNFAIVNTWIWQLKDELLHFQIQQVPLKEPAFPLAYHFRTCRAEWPWSLEYSNAQQ